MYILHYVTDEDTIKVETFDDLGEAEDYINDYEIVEDYSLIEGKILQLG